MSCWIERPLEDCLAALIDYRGKSPTKSETGVPVISAKVVKSGIITHPIEQTIAPSYYNEWMRHGFPEVGDVVMTTEGPLGEVAQLDETTVKYALGQCIVVLRGKPQVLDNDFLKFLLQTDLLQSRLSARATATTVLGISQKALRAGLPRTTRYRQRPLRSGQKDRVEPADERDAGANGSGDFQGLVCRFRSDSPQAKRRNRPRRHRGRPRPGRYPRSGPCGAFTQWLRRQWFAGMVEQAAYSRGVRHQSARAADKGCGGYVFGYGIPFPRRALLQARRLCANLAQECVSEMATRS
jgi:hypothetical protein